MPRLPKALRDLALAVVSERALQRDDADVTFSDLKCWGAQVVCTTGGVQRAYVKQRIKTYRPLPYRLLKRAQFALSVRERLRIYIDDRLFRPPGPRCIIANSHMVERYLLHYYPHIGGRIHVVHHGIDHSRYHPGLREEYRTPVRRKFDIPEDALVGVFVATNWRRKGLWPLLDAMAILTHRHTARPFYLIVVGRGPRMRAQLQARGLRIRPYLRLVGHQPSEVFYGTSDLVLLPTYFDSYGLGVVEGMACGLPVITTVHAGSHEVLPDQGGCVLADPEDTEQMADYIESFMDTERLQNASRAALVAARPYTCEREHRRILNLMMSVSQET